MSVQVLLNRLDKVKQTGVDKFIACCPSHGGKKQSLAIRDDGGKVLVHCFAEGCSIFDILEAVGLTFNDVMPKFLGNSSAQKKPFYAGDVLEISRDEIFIASQICKKVLANTATFNDLERIKDCSKRLYHAVEITKDNGASMMAIQVKARVAERVANAA